MEVSSAMTLGLQGMQAGQRRAEQAAGEIAGQALVSPQQASRTQSAGQTDAVASPAPLTESLEALRLAEHEASAGARVIATADEVMGTLIDTRA
ncbi:hypothetical protein [Pseudomonas sp. NCCP-436]|uniref:hypothetical protein n=1 Tax=Pseudomonas sp. NCCP-436 TaxID=2842481 RepID=UPI001C8129B5|nr:hypothetical protein [Pseudomonas sp. NCCP-436]GIZ12655.1 hypothetical protein NCCP436_20710 [Pseudomonas sp. NCCP-436]